MRLNGIRRRRTLTTGDSYNGDWNEGAEFTDMNYLTLPSALDSRHTTVLTAFELSPERETSQERLGSIFWSN